MKVIILALIVCIFGLITSHILSFVVCVKIGHSMPDLTHTAKLAYQLTKER